MSEELLGRARPLLLWRYRGGTVKFGDLSSVFFVHCHAWCFQSASERQEPLRAANLSALLRSSVTAGFLLAGIFCTQNNK